MSEHGGFTDSGPGYLDDDSGVSTGRVVKVATVAALGGLLFGYDSAVINGAVAAIEKHFEVGSALLGFAVASALLGAAAGAMTAGRIADRIGRIQVMRIAALLFLVSAVGTAFAPNLAVLVVGRIVGGLAVGMASVIAPAYIAETAPARIRGRLGSLQQLAIVIGIFLSLLVDWVLANLSADNPDLLTDLHAKNLLTADVTSLAGTSSGMLWGMEAWRWMFLAMAIPALVYGILATTIPESPRYLVARARIPEARKVLTLLLGSKNLDITITRIQDSLKSDTKPSWKDLKRPGGGIYPIVWVGLLLSVFQQFVGINVIFYYSNILWEAVGFDESQSFLITVITSVVNIIVTLVAIGLVDKLGRKPLLIIGSAGMTVTLGVMAIIFGSATVVDGTPQLSGAAGPIALIAANLFVIFFGMSWGPMVWVLLGEMFPNRFRAAALSLAAAGQWAANWIITVSFPGLKDFSLGFAYGLYALFALLSFLFVAKWVKETKGMSLEDMDNASGITAAGTKPEGAAEA